MQSSSPSPVKRKRSSDPPSPVVTCKNLLLQTVYYLNSAKSKSVCVGFDSTRDFEAVIQFTQVNKKSVIISRADWDSILNCENNINVYFSTGAKSALSNSLISYANYFGRRHLSFKQKRVVDGTFNLNADEWYCLIRLSKLVTFSLQKLLNESAFVKEFHNSVIKSGNIIRPINSNLDFERLNMEMITLIE